MSLVLSLTNAVPGQFPVITSQPSNLTVGVGATATFSVTASGTGPFSYQWRFNAANLSGATDSSYSKSNVQSTDAGSYTVVVTNVAGSVTSGAAVLTVRVPPAITAQPANLTGDMPVSGAPWRPRLRQSRLRPLRQRSTPAGARSSDPGATETLAAIERRSFADPWSEGSFRESLRASWSFGLVAQGADEKEVTLKGTAKCAKCSIKEAKACQAVLVVTEDGKEVKYYVAKNKAGNALHKDICQSDKENVSLTGVVTEKEGKKTITATKYE